MTIQITQQTHEFSIAPQITMDDITEIAQLGFKTIINNRPDNEGGSSQPLSTQLQAAIEALGLTYVYIPIIPNNITVQEVAAFAAAYTSSPKPILGFCRTGIRASNIFRLAQAST